MSITQISSWITRHDERHEALGGRFPSRELYQRDLDELRRDIESLQSTLSRAVWAIVSLVVAVLANLLAIWGGRL